VERMITVTGVTGKLGGIVLDDLRSRVPADQIVAVARTPEKVDAGVEVRLLRSQASDDQGDFAWLGHGVASV